MKLKQSLIMEILAISDTSREKYSRALLNLKSVVRLEKKDKHNFDKEFLDKFDKLILKSENFYNDIPLLIVEKYFYLNYGEIDSYIYIGYTEENQDKELSLYYREVYLLLEKFYQEIFELASEIALMYNMEFKTNSLINNGGKYV